MIKARAGVFAACKAAGIAFLDGVGVENIEQSLREGLMIGAGNEAAADKGRRLKKRGMPW